MKRKRDKIAEIEAQYRGLTFKDLRPVTIEDLLWTKRKGKRPSRKTTRGKAHD